MRAIGLIVASTSISDIKTILKSILATAKRENDGINDLKMQKKDFKERIVIHNIKTDFDNERSDELHGEDQLGEPCTFYYIYYEFISRYKSCIRRICANE